MTTGVCLHFESTDADVYSGRIIDLDAWRYSAKAFGFDSVAIVNLSTLEISWNDEGLVYSAYYDLAAFEEATAGDSVVYLDPEWRFPEGMVPNKLADYTHPTGDVWYVFGPATGFMPAADDGKTWLTVEQAGVGAMHAEHIAPAVMWHRYNQLMGV
jgi:hypothetical protein